MKAMIVCVSVSHGNTKRVADVMGDVLPARVVAPEESDVAELSTCDLVGFGSGVFLGSMHSRLRDFVEALPAGEWGRAFVFATSGFADAGPNSYTRPVVRKLVDKGFTEVDTWTVRGIDTWFPFKPVGGIRKGHPDQTDLDSARRYAEQWRARIG